MPTGFEAPWNPIWMIQDDLNMAIWISSLNKEDRVDSILNSISFVTLVRISLKLSFKISKILMNLEWTRLTIFEILNFEDFKAYFYYSDSWYGWSKFHGYDKFLVLTLILSRARWSLGHVSMELLVLQVQLFLTLNEC